MTDPEIPRAALLKTYHHQSVARQQLLQAFAVYYAPVGARTFLNRLKAAGLRETPSRFHTPQSIAPALRDLLNAGLLESDESNRFRVVAPLVEPLTRHAVRDGLFERLARALEQNPEPWSDPPWQAAQGLRLALYRRDDRQLLRIAGKAAAELDALASHGIWNLVLANPFDAAWFRGLPDAFQALVLRLWLNDANLRFHPAHQALAYAQEFSVRDTPAAAEVRAGIAFQLLNRGHWTAAATTIDRIAPEDPRRAELHAWRFALLGRDDLARSRYEDALAAGRRQTGRRKIALQTLAGLFYPLTLLRVPDPARWLDADAYLDTVERDETHPFRVLSVFLRDAVRARLGRRSEVDRAAFPKMLPAPSVMHWLYALTRYWRRVEMSTAEIALLSEGRRRAADNGYRLWVEEYDALFDRLGRAPEDDAPAPEARDGKRRAVSVWMDTPPETPAPVEADDAAVQRPRWVDAVPHRAAWVAALDALAVLAAEDAEATPRADATCNRTIRLVWNLGFSDHQPSLMPLEQSLRKSGQWSKGRPVALRRLMQERDRMPSATEQDRLVAATLRMEGSGWSGAPCYRFDLARALPALVDHPLVFREDAAGVALTVVRGEPALYVERLASGSGLRLTFHPPLVVADNRDGDGDGEEGLFQFNFNDPDETRMVEQWEAFRTRREARIEAQRRERGETRSGRAGDVVWELETPTRLRVVTLDERARAVAEWVGTGLELPDEGRERAMAVLSGLASRVRVQGELDGAPTETVEADARPWFHLLPAGETLRVELLVFPLGAEGPAFKAGRGGAAVFAEVEGRRVRARRELGDERLRADRVIRACPSLAAVAENDGSDGESEWRLPDLASALSFLEEAQALGDAAVVAWPRGGKFAVRKARGPGALWLKIDRDREWFAVGGGLEVDETLTLDMAKLLEMRRHAVGRFLPLGDGEFLALTEELRKRLDDLALAGEEVGGRLRLDPLASLALERLEADGVRLEADGEWRRRLARYKESSEFEAPVPPGLKAELRDYQIDGYRWLARLARWGVGACLADDMGLGKTIQALALLLHRAAAGPALVVTPMSVCFNWLSEAARFAPALRMYRFGEGDREATLSSLKAYDVVVTSYGLLQQEAERLSKISWATAVLDEAQAIKNMQTKRSKAAMGLSAGFRLLTTGTPLENHLGELWNLFRFLNPGLLGSHARFSERFAGPIERENDVEARSRLRRLVRPFMLRRTKAQVLEELPPRTEIDRLVEPGREERAFYEALRRSAVERLSSKGLSADGEEKRRFLILAEIMKLRRACCNPALVAGAEAPGSAKLEAFLEIMDELLENRHQALVFSQFVDHLSLLRRALDERGVKYQYLDGSTPARERQRAVQAFQGGEGSVFLISLKAGGLGLNLTAADYVVHMDPWWNPAVEDQASDRAHRIGQTRPVTVYRLVARGTIEEKIVELHRSKRALAEGLLSGADDTGAKLDVEALLRLLREE